MQLKLLNIQFSLDTFLILILFLAIIVLTTILSRYVFSNKQNGKSIKIIDLNKKNLKNNIELNNKDVVNNQKNISFVTNSNSVVRMIDIGNNRILIFEEEISEVFDELVDQKEIYDTIDFDPEDENTNIMHMEKVLNPNMNDLGFDVPKQPEEENKASSTTNKAFEDVSETNDSEDPTINSEEYKDTEALVNSNVIENNDIDTVNIQESQNIDESLIEDKDQLSQTSLFEDSKLPKPQFDDNNDELT